MKKNILILIIPILIFSIGCNKAKKELATKIINSYAQAVKEDDKSMMEKIFPDVIYFKEYPKIDKIEIKKIDIKKENVLALCNIYYTTGLGKEVEHEIKFLINTHDSIIVNVSGYLTRKERNQMLSYGCYKTFPDLQPKEDDMDVNFVKNEKIVLNRSNGYEYYAQKAIGKRTKVKLDIKCKKQLIYGYLDHCSNVKIELSISNNSDFNMEYSYEDGFSWEYSYSFPGFIDKKDKLFGCEGNFKLKSGESLSQSFAFRGEYHTLIDTANIKIKPYIETTEDAIKIVNKYYNNEIKQLILRGEMDLWEESYNYKLNLNSK